MRVGPFMVLMYTVMLHEKALGLTYIKASIKTDGFGAQLQVTHLRRGCMSSKKIATANDSRKPEWRESFSSQ